jgi:hypothetical protein
MDSFIDMHKSTITNMRDGNKKISRNMKNYYFRKKNIFKGKNIQKKFTRAHRHVKDKIKKMTYGMHKKVGKISSEKYDNIKSEKISSSNILKQK